MKSDEQACARVQSYLEEVAAHLERMPEREQQDLLRQLESHIHEALQARTGGKDAQASDVEAVLSEMDPPESYGTVRDGRLGGLRRGEWALLISLGSLVVAGLLVLLAGGRMAAWIPFFLFLGGQIAAFVIGIQSWRQSCGKAAVFTSGALSILAVLFCA